MAEQTQKKLGIAERLYTGQLSYDFMKARKFWFTFSAVLVALTLLVLLVLQRRVLVRGLAPLDEAVDACRRLERGEAVQFEAGAPAEVRPLLAAVERLSRHQAQRLGRIRHAAGNLSHALKTPLAVLGQSALRGMTALFVGLALGCVGMDQISGAARYTAGQMELLDGIDIVLVAVGLFAVAEVLYAAIYEGSVNETQNKMSRVHMTARDWKRSWPAWLRGTLIGTPFGCIPAGGTEIPTFLSYATEKKLAKGEDKAEFGGKGAIEGVAGPEAANNATVTAALIPLLTLGIPTSNTTAVLLGAFQNYGINPGPQLFTSSAALVWALIASLYIGNIMLLVLNLPMVGLWVKLLRIPKPQLYAGILIFATVGAYGMRQSSFDLFLLYVIGAIGVVMRRFDFPTAPVVVGMILGPLAEAQLRNAMSIGEGKWSVFVERPVSIFLIVVIVTVLLLPRILRWRAARRVA